MKDYTVEVAYGKGKVTLLNAAIINRVFAAAVQWAVKNLTRQ